MLFNKLLHRVLAQVRLQDHLYEAGLAISIHEARLFPKSYQDGSWNHNSDPVMQG
jgi:hypothetical protein